MGPANDDEPVHIEIQAARMATDVLDEFSHLGWGVPGCAWLACSRHRPTDEIVTDAGWAGYLARQIWAAHDHSHPEPAE